MNPGLLSVVSVDVLALAYDHDGGRVMLATPQRVREPFAGRRALPGVVVRSGERLADAAHRALATLETFGRPSALGQIRTFDEPMRDPRGPSLSIAMWATFPATSPAGTPWVPLAQPGALAFDHNDIVAGSFPVLAGLLWQDVSFTRGLTGATFTSTDAAVITQTLRGAPVHRPNLVREVGRVPGLRDAGVAPSTGGRPPRLWAWSDPHP